MLICMTVRAVVAVYCVMPWDKISSYNVIIIWVQKNMKINTETESTVIDLEEYEVSLSEEQRLKKWTWYSITTQSNW